MEKEIYGYIYCIRNLINCLATVDERKIDRIASGSDRHHFACLRKQNMIGVAKQYARNVVSVCDLLCNACYGAGIGININGHNSGVISQ